ncbi:MAG: hypothetical protein K8S98_10940 [Planctomycetes bacterium]|nr:hypothetical protein [Planctomycetota bacterium]
MAIERARPTVIELDLDRLAPGEPRPWSEFRREFVDADPELDALGRGGGEALALVELWRRDGADVPFVLAVGEGVRRGLQTASRATVLSRSPLSGLVADGQVGSDLARRLASLADAFVLGGRAGANVLVLDGHGARVEEHRDLAGLEPRAVHAALQARLGLCATLSIGVAGERGAAIANLAACSSGAGATSVAHYVGRGGLGAVLGARGLKAIAVAAPAVETVADLELVRLLLASPRLAARAEGGTFELAESLAARGELFARGGSSPVTREEARRFTSSIEAASRAAHGCRGCPTPCGVVLEGAFGERRGARFSGGHALGFQLGLERGEDALALLAACDRIGVDAKELGAALALAAQARELGRLDEAPAFGARDALLGCVEDVVASRGLGSRLARGAAAFARELGLVATTARGQAVRRERSLASLLGQCVSARGPDPMRTFSFLAGDAGARRRLLELVAPLALPPGAEDPDSSVGKGRLVWWHENLAAALDATGFCAFSAGALLLDGTATLDELATTIAPRAWLEHQTSSPGWALLDGGDRMLALVRALETRWGADVDVDRPAWARERLELPGMLDEYRELRGRVSSPPFGGEPAFVRAERWSRESEPIAVARTARATRLGRVHVRSGGRLAASYGTECEVELDLPSDVLAVLGILQASRPDGPELCVGAEPVPAVYRDGRRLEPNSEVRAGDRLDLVLAISGG